MIYTVKESEVFIPSWNGNKDLPEKDQIKIIIRMPSAAEVSKVYTQYKDASTAEFLCYVHGVENMKIEGDGIGEKIKSLLGGNKATPEALLETPGLTDLVVEVKNRYREYSIDKKKLEK